VIRIIKFSFGIEDLDSKFKELRKVISNKSTKDRKIEIFFYRLLDNLTDRNITGGKYYQEVRVLLEKNDRCDLKKKIDYYLNQWDFKEFPI